MKILIIGNGGREHAIAWKCAQSNQTDSIFVAPGNAGTALEPKILNIPIDVLDVPRLVNFAQKKSIDLTIVGPEAPLAAGIVNIFEKNGLTCFGPTQAAAQLEVSKAYCKNFLKSENIPTAKFEIFTEKTPALDYLKAQKFPLVIKASGLAGGKGVVIAKNHKQAEDAITSILEQHQFGDAGNQIVIEEFLEGEELSFIVMVDGENILPLASSQDHKRRDAGDKGPNTGGMGAYSPAPILTESLHAKIMDHIMKPTIKALAKRGTTYRGFLYAGLMISESGNPKLLEFNCRLGDPETQTLLFRLKSDLVSIFNAASQKCLDKIKIEWDAKKAVCLILASGGYPKSYRKNDPIEGLCISKNLNYKVFHSGTIERDGQILTNGGRVLGITAKGNSLEIALKTAYSLAKKIHWTDYFYRKDIGYRALKERHELFS